jgi:hypothetical protein
MKEIRIKLSEPQYVLLSTLAEKSDTIPDELAQEQVISWLNQHSEETSAAGENKRDEFIKMRMEELDFPTIARKLGCPEEKLLEWDSKIRGELKSWNGAYFLMRRASDPLSWEMKMMDRFFELWGQRPQQS